jgi:hypothetical protein
MIQAMHNIDNTRAHRKRCSCGRFYVRRIIERDEPGERVEVDKSQAIAGMEGFNRFFKSHPARDGLCERCYKYGSPEYSELNTIGGAIRNTMRGTKFKKQRALAKAEDGRWQWK